MSAAVCSPVAAVITSLHHFSTAAAAAVAESGDIAQRLFVVVFDYRKYVCSIVATSSNPNSTEFESPMFFQYQINNLK